EAFFAEHGLGRPDVAGNSMGGAIALELARRGSVRSATALSPAGFWSPREFRYAQLSFMPLLKWPKVLRPAMVRAARTRPARSVLFAQLMARPARMPADEAAATLLDAWASPAFETVLRAAAGYAYGPWEGDAGTPVTVAWGSKDRLLLYRR